MQHGGDGHRLCTERLGGTSGGLFPNGGVLAKPWLLLREDTLQRPGVLGHSGWDPAASPSSAACCRGGGSKLGRGLLPGLEGHLDSAPRLSSRRTSPGAVKGGEALRGLQGSAPGAAPLRLGRRGRLLGQQRAGLTFGKVLVPRGCRVPPTEPLLPAAPGVCQQDTRAGAAAQSALARSGCSIMLVPEDRDLPQRLVSSVGCTLEISRQPVQGAARTGTAGIFPWCLP